MRTFADLTCSTFDTQPLTMLDIVHSSTGNPKSTNFNWTVYNLYVIINVVQVIEISCQIKK